MSQTIKTASLAQIVEAVTKMVHQVNDGMYEMHLNSYADKGAAASDVSDVSDANNELSEGKNYELKKLAEFEDKYCDVCEILDDEHRKIIRSDEYESSSDSMAECASDDSSTTCEITTPVSTRYEDFNQIIYECGLLENADDSSNIFKLIDKLYQIILSLISDTQSLSKTVAELQEKITAAEHNNIMLEIPIVLDNEDEKLMPVRGTAGAAGYDLKANEDGVIQPGEWKLIKTGVKMALPAGHYLRIAPRSGLALKNGIDTLAGVVDEDYDREIGVILLNNGKVAFSYNKYDRIAQGILEKYHVVQFKQVAELPKTTRNGGFGSTGK